jgi:hypothetical protein
VGLFLDEECCAPNSSSTYSLEEGMSKRMLIVHATDTINFTSLHYEKPAAMASMTLMDNKLISK